MLRRLHAPGLLVLTAVAAGAGLRPAPPGGPSVPPPAATPATPVTPEPAATSPAILDPVVPPDAATRAAFALDPRHARMVDVDGFPVLGSADVPDAALREAAHVIRRMIAGRPALLPPIVAARVRLAVMNHDEFTTDVPEHADLEPAAYWDRRARGLGATIARPAVSCGVENLLDYPGDPYAGESILVHEFAHVVHEFALAALDPSFDRRLTDAYAAAMAEGRWAGTYAATNPHEYFAEAAQAYFDTNRQDDAQHNHVDTREELREHDPRLFALVDEAFGGTQWRHRPVASRRDDGHLAGHDFAAAPRFAWPERITAAWDRHRAASAAALTPLDVVPAAGGAAPPASTGGGERTRIRFVNRRRDSVQIVWIDALGQARGGYGWVQARGSHEQTTFAGHTWLLVDAAGDPVAWAVATDAPGLVEIAGPPEDTDPPAGTDR